MQKRQSARELRLISQSSAPTEECSSRHHFNMDRWRIIFHFIHFSLHQSFFIYQDWSENFSFPYPEHLNVSEKYFKNAPELFAIRICEGSQLTPRTSLKTREELNAFQRNRKRHQRKWSRILLVSTDTIVQSRIMIRSQKILTSSRRNLLAEIHQPFENHLTSFTTYSTYGFAVRKSSQVPAGISWQKFTNRLKTIWLVLLLIVLMVSQSENPPKFPQESPGRNSPTVWKPFD